MSNTYLRWAQDNFDLNNLKGASFIRADVFRFLEQPPDKKLYDIIIADPPSFSVSTKMTGNSLGGVFDIKKDYPLLLAKCLRLLRNDGILFFCVNERSFNIKTEDIQDTLNGESGGIIVKDMSARIRDEDFKGRKIPRCYEIARQLPL
jgi:23S rRNA G2069 N7-methylase RlmK/C1962 C5-methylase RlmI